MNSGRKNDFPTLALFSSAPGRSGECAQSVTRGSSGRPHRPPRRARDGGVRCTPRACALRGGRRASSRLATPRRVPRVAARFLRARGRECDETRLGGATSGGRPRDVDASCARGGVRVRRVRGPRLGRGRGAGGRVGRGDDRREDGTRRWNANTNEQRKRVVDVDDDRRRGLDERYRAASFGFFRGRSSRCTHVSVLCVSRLFGRKRGAGARSRRAGLEREPAEPRRTSFDHSRVRLSRAPRRGG